MYINKIQIHPAQERILYVYISINQIQIHPAQRRINNIFLKLIMFRPSYFFHVILKLSEASHTNTHVNIHI